MYACISNYNQKTPSNICSMSTFIKFISTYVPEFEICKYPCKWFLIQLNYTLFVLVLPNIRLGTLKVLYQVWPRFNYAESWHSWKFTKAREQLWLLDANGIWAEMQQFRENDEVWISISVKYYSKRMFLFCDISLEYFLEHRWREAITPKNYGSIWASTVSISGERCLPLP